jgi:hypothetical protein
MSTSSERVKRYRERQKALHAEDVTPPDVTPLHETDVTRWKKPDGADEKLWAYCVERAARAARYAEKFPYLIMPSDRVFQSPLWQYERELKYRI